MMPYFWQLVINLKQKIQYLSNFVPPLENSTTRIAILHRWYLWDIFYLTDNYEASLVTGGIIGVTGLMVVGCLNSIHGGLIKDGVKQSGITLPCFYITYFYIEDVQKTYKKKSLS